MPFLEEGEQAIGEQTSELGGIVQMEKMILDKVTGLHKGCGDGHMFKKSKSQSLAKDAK